MSGGRCLLCGSLLPFNPEWHECSTTSPQSPAYDQTVGRCSEPGFYVLDGRAFRRLVRGQR